MATTQSKKQIVGHGMFFFNDLWISGINRMEVSRSLTEVLGRAKGEVLNVGHGNKDFMLRLHLEDMRADAMAFLNGRCSALSSLASFQAAQEGSLTFQHMEPVTLADSATASTLTIAGATGVEVFKRDYSVKYTKTTDYTLTSSEVTLVAAGAIADGQQVFVSYKHVDASAVYNQIGKGAGPLMGSVRAVIVNEGDGKLYEFTHSKCAVVGDLSFVVGQNEEFPGFDVEMRIIKDEDSDHPYGQLGFGSTAVPAV